MVEAVVGVEHHPPTRLMYEVAALMLRDLGHDGDPRYVVRDHIVETYLSSVGEDDIYCALVGDGGALIAAASLMHHRDDGCLTKVYEFVVEHGQRNAGHGRALMELIAQEAKAQGDDAISLCAQKPGFYAKLGFAATGEEYGGHPIMTASPDDVLASRSTAQD